MAITSNITNNASQVKNVSSLSNLEQQITAILEGQSLNTNNSSMNSVNGKVEEYDVNGGLYKNLSEYRKAHNIPTKSTNLFDIDAVKKAKSKGKTVIYEIPDGQVLTEQPSATQTTVTDTSSSSVDLGNDTANQIYEFLKKKGMDDVQIAAILGNLQQETGSSFNYTANYERINRSDNYFTDQMGNVVYTSKDLEGLSREEKIKKVKGLVPRYGGLGLIQWTGGHYDSSSGTWVADKGADRKSKFLNYCNAHNYKWDDLNAQLEFFYTEYQSWSDRSTFESYTDVSSAAKLFCKSFECPEPGSEDTRASYAKKLLEKINNGKTTTNNSTSKSTINTNMEGVPANGSNNKVPYYKQGGGSSWASVPFGDGTIATSGCSITSLAMVLSYLKGGDSVSSRVTPADVRQSIIDNTGSYKTYHVPGAGASWDIFPAVAKFYGVNCEQISSDSIVQSLKDGKPVIMSCHAGDFTSGGHFIVLTGVDSEGNIYVNDPNGKHEGYSYQTWSLERIVKNGKGGYWSFSN